MTWLYAWFLSIFMKYALVLQLGLSHKLGKWISAEKMMSWIHALFFHPTSYTCLSAKVQFKLCEITVVVNNILYILWIYLLAIVYQKHHQCKCNEMTNCSIHATMQIAYIKNKFSAITHTHSSISYLFHGQTQQGEWFVLWNKINDGGKLTLMKWGNIHFYGVLLCSAFATWSCL